MVEAGFCLACQPEPVRGSDLSFVSAQRIHATGLPEGFFLGAPDLAVEIVSPGDTDVKAQGKVMDYLPHETHQVWVVRPRQRTVAVHHPNGTADVLQEKNVLEGTEVLPGFTLPVSEIFA